MQGESTKMILIDERIKLIRKTIFELQSGDRLMAMNIVDFLRRNVGKNLSATTLAVGLVVSEWEQNQMWDYIQNKLNNTE